MFRESGGRICSRFHGGSGRGRTPDDGEHVRVRLLLLPLLALAPFPLGLQAQEPWWREAVCYEVFVRSFLDSDGDGVGDLNGLIEKLAYINDGDPGSHTDLGANCIWLMPVAQSPSYHGYDVTNYYEIERDYGTLEDFRRLVEEAHRRGIRIVVDLVLNHTSSEHYFFRSAAMDTTSPYRDWYLWSPTQRRMPGWEAPTWHRNPFRDEYYYGLFWSGMPDLNLDNPEVKAEAERVARFWLEEVGVDGFRLDAVAHFFEEGGRWIHVPAVHPWLRDYAAAIRSIDPDAFTVGEVYDDTDAILASYPDQLDAYFLFEVADALIDAALSGSGDRLVAAVERVQREVPRGRGATFLRNHDQTRTLTDLGGDIDRARLAASLLLTLPGIPFVYYGEEIGMTGSKRDGDPRLRTPMHWALEPGVGFTGARLPWEPLHPDSLTANVQAQESDPASLLNHYRRLVHLRTSSTALTTGDFVALDASDPSALAFVRRADDRVVLVVANLDDRPLEGITLSSGDRILEPGRYRAAALLGPTGPGPVGEATLDVAADGRVRAWVPAPSLAPLEARVLELTGQDR